MRCRERRSRSSEKLFLPADGKRGGFSHRETDSRPGSLFPFFRGRRLFIRSTISTRFNSSSINGLVFSGHDALYEFRLDIECLAENLPLTGGALLEGNSGNVLALAPASSMPGPALDEV